MTRGLEDCVVLDCAHHQVTSALRAPALEDAANRQVVRLGAGSREDDLALRASEHGGEPVPGRVDRRARRPPRCVNRGRIPLSCRQVRQHLLEHRSSQGRGRGVVEMDPGHDGVGDAVAIAARTRSMTASVKSVVEACPPRSEVETPARSASKSAWRMTLDARRQRASGTNPSRAEAARIIAIGLATFFPSRLGAVPCGASAITTDGTSGSSPKPEQQRLGAGDAAEERQHQVAQAITVAVQSRDDERVTGAAEEQRIGRVDELRFVVDLGMALRGGVELLLEHPLVDPRHRELGAPENPGTGARCVHEGELGDRPARGPRDVLGAVRDLVAVALLAPLLRVVCVVDGHAHDADRSADPGDPGDAGDALPGAQDHASADPLPEQRIGAADIGTVRRRDRRRLQPETGGTHRLRSLDDHGVCGLASMASDRSNVCSSSSTPMTSGCITRSASSSSSCPVWSPRRTTYAGHGQSVRLHPEAATGGCDGIIAACRTR